MKIAKLKDWLPGLEGPLLIAGPCSAESEEQILKSAAALKKIPQMRIFRAGIWKPRTRPNAFEGVGPEGLPWLSRAGKENDLLVATEVANSRHVEEALKNNIDILWIGARTTASPFAVQEIADALKGADIPVMVKNPVNAELSLWIGGLERINQAGITKLVAIHRGFSGLENGIYRNLPMWQLPLELKRKIPELPIVCDASHITGKSEMIEKVCQMALDYDLDGLMIESHPNPSEAKSDARQQVTPEHLGEICKNLKLVSPSCEDQGFEHGLEELRSKIDRLDKDVIEILKMRFDMCEVIGSLKRKYNVTPLQVNRMEQLMKERAETADSLGLSRKFVDDLFHIIHEESIRLQSLLKEEDSDES